MKVTVTEEDIAFGIPKSCAACPVARALDRELGSMTFVYRSECVVHVEDKRTYHELPKVVVVWIARYDAGFPAHPFSFVLQ